MLTGASAAVIALALNVAITPTEALAQDVEYDQGGSDTPGGVGGTGNWNETDLNWVDGTGETAFTTGDNVTFNDDAGPNPYTVTINEGATITTGSMTVNTSAALTITGAGVNDQLAILGDLAINAGASVVFELTGQANSTSGAGALTIGDGTNASTFSIVGDVTHTGDTTIINMGTLALTGTAAVTSGAFSGAGTLAVSGTNQTVTFTSGDINDIGAFELSNGADATFADGFTGFDVDDVAIGEGSVLRPGLFNADGADGDGTQFADLATVSGGVTGGGRIIMMSSGATAGSALTFDGNSQTIAVAIDGNGSNEGRLRFAGTGTLTTTVTGEIGVQNAVGFLDLADNNTVTFTENVVIGVGATIGTGAIAQFQGTATQLRFGTGAGTIVVGNGTDAATLTLNATSDHAGGTTLNDMATLVLNAAGTLTLVEDVRAGTGATNTTIQTTGAGQVVFDADSMVGSDAAPIGTVTIGTDTIFDGGLDAVDMDLAAGTTTSIRASSRAELRGDVTGTGVFAIENGSTLDFLGGRGGRQPFPPRSMA